MKTFGNDEWFRLVMLVSSDSLRVSGGFGAVRFRRSSYVFPPILLRNTATAFLSGMSFATKNKWTRSMYVRGDGVGIWSKCLQLAKLILLGFGELCLVFFHYAMLAMLIYTTYMLTGSSLLCSHYALASEHVQYMQ